MGQNQTLFTCEINASSLIAELLSALHGCGHVRVIERFHKIEVSVVKKKATKLHMPKISRKCEILFASDY